MKKGLKLALALVLVVATIALAACNNTVDFEKAFAEDNFKNVTIKMGYFVPDSVKDTDLGKALSATATTIKVAGDKMLTTLKSGTGENARTIDAYQEKDAAGDDFITWTKTTVGTGTPAYAKAAVKAEEAGSDTPEFEGFLIEDFEVKDGYYVLTDAAKTKEKYAVIGTLFGESYNIKLKFSGGKLTGMIVSGSISKSLTGLDNDITIEIKYTFSNYGNTSVTKPDWINDTNYPA